MPQKFTPEHLLALLYNEISPEQKQEIFQQMVENPAHSEEFANLSEIVSLLDAAELDPHPTSVALIMEYSAKTHEVQHA